MSHSSPFSPSPSDHEQNERQPPAPPLAPAAGGVDASDVAMRPRSLYGSQKASLILDVIVVGCGIGGLGAAFCLTQAGHRVTIIESSPVLGEIGAGIQISPNTSRLLRRWGLGEHLEEFAVRPEGMTYRRYSTGERIGFSRFGEALARDYGSAYYHMHRADLHKLLHDLVAPHVTILLDSTVIGCDPGPVSPSVTLKSGEVIRADLILGADGVKSYIQRVILGKPNPAELTGDAVCRAVIPTSLMMEDPELRELIEHPQMTAWIGPGRCMVGYPIRRKELYNLLLLHPDPNDGSVGSRVAEEKNADKMRHDYVGFEPRVRKLLGFVESTRRWRLKDGKPIEKWIHESGRVALLGDACHPMMPYRSQGAAMAIEDAAVLANLLSRISHHSQLKPLLKAFQDLRLRRTVTAQDTSRLVRRILILPDGPEQIERDETLRKAMDLVLSVDSETFGLESERNQYLQNEKEKCDILFGYDADAEVDKWWAAHGREMEVFARSKL